MILGLLKFDFANASLGALSHLAQRPLFISRQKSAHYRHYVTDIHATVLHQLGLDPHKLEVPGHKRLEIPVGL